MNKIKALAVGSTALLATASAHAAENQYVTELNDALTSIQSMWTVVAGIMIGVAVVTVGLRFFRKAK